MPSVFKTTRDIVIPAGTVLCPPPTLSSRWSKDFEVVVGLGKDHTGYFTLNVKDASNNGYIEEIKGDDDGAV